MSFFAITYDTEIDFSSELSPDTVVFLVHYWHHKMDDRFGRIDIITEMSLFSSFLALPKEGHLETTVDIKA